METNGYLISLKHSLWHMLAGTRGGLTRIRIIELLMDRPYNTNQLHEKLSMDYKTIQHHVRVLMEGNIIIADERKRYGSMYLLSQRLEENISIFHEILEKIGKKKLNRENEG